MRMRRVRPHCHVNRHRNACGIGRGDQAVRGKCRLGQRLQPPPQRFADPDAVADAFDDRLIHLAAGFFRRAEAPVRQHRFHVLAGLARDGDFKIVNRRRPIQHEPRCKTAAHQI